MPPAPSSYGERREILLLLLLLLVVVVVVVVIVSGRLWGAQPDVSYVSGRL